MLKKIAESIQQNKNVLEKKDINQIVQFINENSFKSSRIYSDIGEDSAAIKDNDKYILLTTDRIKTTFIENFPFGAGFSSILVGIDDIYCCGGKPLAASIILSFPDKSKGQKIIEGITEGSKKFQIPIIRGHTKTNSHCYELSSTMIGEINKEDYISGKNAQIGDRIILASDFDGIIGKASSLYWDTVTFKDSKEILRKRKALNIIAQNHLSNASKDISNGGIFGTLMQLIKYSDKGADVNINKIEIPTRLTDIGYTLDTYCEMFLTTSYILTAPENKCKKIIEIFNDYGLNATDIGIIIKKNVLKINNGTESIEAIKF